MKLCGIKADGRNIFWHKVNHRINIFENGQICNNIKQTLFQAYLSSDVVADNFL